LGNFLPQGTNRSAGKKEEVPNDSAGNPGYQILLALVDTKILDQMTISKNGVDDSPEIPREWPVGE